MSAHNNMSMGSSGSEGTKIVMLGDCAVGKTRLMATLCGTKYAGYGTIGANVACLYHEYRAGTSEQRSELVELFDIGGSYAHRSAASVFMDGAAGAIILHNLSNSKTEENLWQWLGMIDHDILKRPPTARSLSTCMEGINIPVLIVGTHADQVNGPRTLINERSPYDRISVDGRRPIVAGSTNSVILARFFDSAIDRVRAPVNDRRRKVIWSGN